MRLGDRYKTDLPCMEMRRTLVRCTFIHQNTRMGKTNTDQKHLLKLRDLYAKERALPSSLTQMADILGFSSANAALKLRDRLCAAGVMRTGPGGKMQPTEQFFALPVMDATVRAGVPEEIESQSWADAITLESFLVKRPSRTVLVKVRGDSMRDAGILDGDLAIVERTEHVQDGQIVVAIVDGAYTIKELRHEGTQPVLMPHNPEHKPIRPQSDLEIYGVFRGLARSRWPTKAQGGKTL